MRVTDVFLSIPPLVLALAILGFLRPNLFNAMIAVSVMWWPWYARLTYNVTRQVATEGYVTAAEVVGASTFHIVFREILPNCAAPIVTKMTLDLGFVILLGSSLSFLGLGVQPPTPDLGSMVAEGRQVPAGPVVAGRVPRPRHPGRRARLQPDGRRRVNDLLDVER